MIKCATLFAVVVASGASASIIDFETTPSYLLPVDEASLDRNTQSVIDGVGVSFGFDTTMDSLADTDANFEQRDKGGGPEDGCLSTIGSDNRDTEAPAFGGQLGEFFLRTSLDVSDNDMPSTFVITFDTALADLNGEIWDIDARQDGTFEQWRVRGFDAIGMPVAM